MVIREATIDDVARLEAGAREFFAVSRFLRNFSSQHFTNAWRALLESGVAVIIVAEQDDGELAGAIAGVAYPDICTGELTATEFFWFSRPRHRGAGIQLYRRFEEWSRRRHCALLRMVHLQDVMPGRLTTVYRRLGFEPVETHWQKELQPWP
jgi:GNAT superfamily N-acetyltransferase